LLRYVVPLFLLLNLACYRREYPADHVLVCPPQWDVQRVILPYTVKGMGSAHYPGPPYTRESFDVFLFDRGPDGRPSRLAQVLLYGGKWPSAPVRGVAEFRQETLELNLEYFSEGRRGRSDVWRPYSFNGSYRLQPDKCDISPPVCEGSPPASHAR
jgi:hypothetical protein